METIDQRSVLLGYDFNPEALILGGGDFPTHPIPLSFLQKRIPLICCDGAANQCHTLGIHPWRVVGDGDSLSAESRISFRDIIRTFPDQETNDQTKAVTYLKTKGITQIVVLAATGRREDHTLGNISLLGEYLKQGLDVRMYTDYGVFIPCRDTTSFACPVGTAVSVFNFDAHHMTSEGLAYSLYDLTSWWQGTLNHSVSPTFRIVCEGDYLVYLSYENKKLRSY